MTCTVTNVDIYMFHFFINCLMSMNTEKMISTIVVSPRVLWGIKLAKQRLCSQNWLVKVKLHMSPSIPIWFILHVLFPVLHNSHWSNYCINTVHRCIDMLDLNDYKQKCTDSDDHHAVVGKKIVTHPNEAFQSATDSKFPVFVISRWPLFNTPKQVLENDCAFFAMNFRCSTMAKDRRCVLWSNQLAAITKIESKNI